MATTPSHAIQGGLITYYALKLMYVVLSWLMPVAAFILTPILPVIGTFFVTLGGVACALPDIVGDIEPEKGSKDKVWNWYHVMHTEVAEWALRNWQYVYTLLLWFHAWQDKYFHDPVTGKWTKKGYVLEVLIDIVLITIIILELRRL